MPTPLRTEPILLISYGYSSRASDFAIYLLRCFNIQLLILPSHSTHILQPFDVGIAAALKMKFRKEFILEKFDFDEEIEFFSKINKTLKFYVEALIEAWLCSGTEKSVFMPS